MKNTRKKLENFWRAFFLRDKYWFVHYYLLVRILLSVWSSYVRTLTVCSSLYLGGIRFPGAFFVIYLCSVLRERGFPCCCCCCWGMHHDVDSGRTGNNKEGRAHAQEEESERLLLRMHVGLIFECVVGGKTRDEPLHAPPEGAAGRQRIFCVLQQQQQ